MMNRNLLNNIVGFASATLISTLGFSQSALAVKFGPFLDLKLIFPLGTDFTVDTKLGVTLPIPGICLECSVKDKARITTTKSFIPGFVNTYVEITQVLNNVFDPNSSVILTDVWAYDLDPFGNPQDIPLQTDFNPTDPELSSVSDETFIGRLTGTNYLATTVTSTLANLSTLLPGYDLSSYTGDPNSIVYVAQATLPAYDVLAKCPEPSSTLACLVLGTLGAATTLNRKVKSSKSTLK